MVVEVNIVVNHLIGFRESGWFVSVDALRFENGEEIFRHGIVIRISAS